MIETRTGHDNLTEKKVFQHLPELGVVAVADGEAVG